MIAIVVAVLLLWFGTVIWAYAFGQRNEAREWAAWYLDKMALDPSDENLNTTEIPPPPPAPPDDTDPGRRIKEGGWPPR